MTEKTLLILGANSDIAKAVAKRYAKEGYNLTLMSRNIERLSDFAADLKVRYLTKVTCLEFDILNTGSHKKKYNLLPSTPNGVICAVGYLGNQSIAQAHSDELSLITQTNYTAIAQFLELVAVDMCDRKSGFIIGISSVAGDRGRKSNYLYGAAKAALSAYLSGLRNRLDVSGIQVLTVKPGFVETAMTASMDFPAILTAKPNEVANSIYNAQVKGRDVVYSKPIWRLIMIVIKTIPEFIFKKLSL